MSISAEWKRDCDLANRDPNQINTHVKVAYEDVLAETESARSIDCVWKYSYKCFNMWKALCYIIFTTLCGIPCAMCWGCGFACVAIYHIWCLTPCMSVMSVFKRCNEIYSDCCIRPMCEAYGWLFWAFKGCAK